MKSSNLLYALSLGTMTALALTACGGENSPYESSPAPNKASTSFNDGYHFEGFFTANLRHGLTAEATDQGLTI